MNRKIQFNFKTPESSPGFLLYKLHTKWENGLKGLLKSYNLTHPQFVTLTTTAWFVTFGTIPTQKEISEKTGIDVMTTSVVIRGLLKKGYIERIHNSNDTRSYHISLTDTGASLVEQSMNAVDNYDNQFFACLDFTSRESLKKMMNQLIH